MKATTTPAQRLLATLTIALVCGSLATMNVAHARQGATDPIPGTSNGTVKSGGGSGGGKSTPAPAPTPVPVVNPQPLVVAPLAFTAAGSVNGVLPVCTGAYRIDPYYPTLSLMTVDVQTSSLNVPDGTVLYLTVNIVGGTGYPFTSNAILISGQSGLCTLSEYITPGSTITRVVITDSFGTIIFAGL